MAIVCLSTLTSAFAEDTNTVSQVLALYGGFEQPQLEGWQSADARVTVEISTAESRGKQPAPTGYGVAPNTDSSAESREGKQCVEIVLPQATKPLYCTPGIRILPQWKWDCSKRSALKFSVNARQRYQGYNLYAELSGQSEKGEPFTFCFIALEAREYWTYCRDSKRVWNPTAGSEIAKPIANTGLTRKPQVYYAWLPGLSDNGLPRQNKWIDFEGALADAFAVEGAPPRPAFIVFQKLEIRGYIADTIHYWIDAVSLGQE
ncbi:MAG: hypothetical protein HY360_11795 [Verrucomicrobia bacterium]|nr:hypothetical protein [Verrucomicrobiota bacterium]